MTATYRRPSIRSAIAATVKVGAALASVFALSACTSAPPGGNSIGFGTVVTRDCIIAAPQSTVLFGDFVTPTTSPIEVMRVELNGASGLRVDGVYFLDPSLGTPIRSWGRVPSGEPIWEARVDAVGATLSKGNTRNLVIQAKVMDEAITKVDSVSVTYSIGRNVERATGAISYEFDRTCE